MEIARNVLRVIVISFFGFIWTFLIMPVLEMSGWRLTTLDRVIAYAIVPFIGLVVAQILIRRIGGHG
ncbi:MAG: hypothetical protein QXQ70_03200 [Candidatus Caldarchaeum sp.]